MIQPHNPHALHRKKAPIYPEGPSGVKTMRGFHDGPGWSCQTKVVMVPGEPRFEGKLRACGKRAGAWSRGEPQREKLPARLPVPAVCGLPFLALVCMAWETSVVPLAPNPDFSFSTVVLRVWAGRGRRGCWPGTGAVVVHLGCKGRVGPNQGSEGALRLPNGRMTLGVTLPPCGGAHRTGKGGWTDAECRTDVGCDIMPARGPPELWTP